MSNIKGSDNHVQGVRDRINQYHTEMWLVSLVNSKLTISVSKLRSATPKDPTFETPGFVAPRAFFSDGVLQCRSYLNIETIDAKIQIDTNTGYLL